MTTMTVGVPREVKTDEHRVAITPDGVLEMSHRGAVVLVEAGAGVDSGITDDDYRGAGAEIVASAPPTSGARRPRPEGQGATAVGARLPPLRPRAVHVPASRRLPRPRHGG